MQIGRAGVVNSRERRAERSFLTQQAGPEPGRREYRQRLFYHGAPISADGLSSQCSKSCLVGAAPTELIGGSMRDPFGGLPFFLRNRRRVAPGKNPSRSRPGSAAAKLRKCEVRALHRGFESHSLRQLTVLPHSPLFTKCLQSADIFVLVARFRLQPTALNPKYDVGRNGGRDGKHDPTTVASEGPLSQSRHVAGRWWPLSPMHR